MNRLRALTLSLVLSAAAFAQTAVDPAQNLRFRNLGPAVSGGRVTAVAGVPDDPRIYYVGTAAGGVYKSEDGGQTWRQIFEHFPVSTVGAMALAPSNPNLVWLGTGEANIRNDIVTGRGVYFSPDGGQSWRFMGLADAGQISSVIVHPQNPDVVFVGVLGHAWGPNQERGVFRTTDAGKTWQKVLYIDDTTGVSDMVMDPSNPMILYAGMWQVQRFPWMLNSGGASSGIYRSNDGGTTWKKLADGLPKSPTGRVGLAVAPSNPRHVYALVEAKSGALWDSHDYGEHWTPVSDNRTLDARPFYFSHLYVAPNNEEKVYFLSFDILVSSDGGKTSRLIGRGVHADHHSLWIDPQHPERMIEGNDGGVYTTWNGGETWRYHDDLPIEQFYSVALDDRTPYTVCGGLQDNSAWCGPGYTPGRGAIPNQQWITTVGGDGQYAVPALGKSPMVYSDSQSGVIEALDRDTGRVRRVRPYPLNQEDLKLSDLKYRFNWTSPIAVSPADGNTVYLGGNVLFRSKDAGAHWDVISPDLTRNDKSKQVLTGGDIGLDLSGAENYDTILSLAVTPDGNTIWAGTDDGVVQVTRDGGKSWSNVTPKGIPEWGRVQQIEVSPFAADTCYVAIDFHESDNNKPYVFKTHDGGKTWTSISAGLPDTDPARVVRESPSRRGFLVLGTDTGVFYSPDDGQTWTPLNAGFPTTPVYDLKFQKQKRDLVVATHGRGLFALDDVSSLEQMTQQVAASSLHLFEIQPAHHWSQYSPYGRGRPFSFSGQNRETGAIIQYWLKSAIEAPSGQRASNAPPRGPVRIEIRGPNGERVRTLNGAGRAGINRVSWDLTYDPATRLNLGATERDSEGGFFGGGNPAALPGQYKVTVTANGESQTQTIEVGPDPRFAADLEAFRAQTRLALEVRDATSRLNAALNRSAAMHGQIVSMQRLLSTEGGFSGVLQQARALDQKLSGWQDPIYNPAAQNDSKAYLHGLARLSDRMQRLLNAITADYDVAPSAALQEEWAALRQQVDGRVLAFNTLIKEDVEAFNRRASQAGAGTLYAGPPIETKASDVAGSDK